jgi:hypothetical protein
MRSIVVALTLSTALAPPFARSVAAQPSPANVNVCVSIDEARDSLQPDDRASALRLMSLQFELAGWRVVSDPCVKRYQLVHLRLGAHILVFLTGSGERREGAAAGMEDLPALYNQMVRSIVTGLPMSGFNVIDRTNVTLAQSRANRVHSDHFAYARVGYGGVFGDRVYGTPAFGFGYRAELDSLGLDVSFLNVQSSGGSYMEGGGAGTFSLVKLQALHFLQPTSNASPYLGGGLSWGSTRAAAVDANSRSQMYSSDWHGHGLQAELTLGYELPRASTLRIFVEGNVVLPFYRVRSESYSVTQPRMGVVTSERYAPSAVVSVGLGWQSDRFRRW